MFKLYVCEKGFGTHKIGFYETLKEAKKALKEDADSFFEFFNGTCTYTITAESYNYNVTLSSN